MHWIVLCCTLCGNWALGRLKHLWGFQSFFNGWCLIWKGIFTCSRVFPLAPGVSMAITVEMQKGENTRLFAFSKSLNKRLPNVFTPFVTNRDGGSGFVLFPLVIISFTWDSEILGQSSSFESFELLKVLERKVVCSSLDPEISSSERLVSSSVDPIKSSSLYSWRSKRVGERSAACISCFWLKKWKVGGVFVSCLSL